MFLAAVVFAGCSMSDTSQPEVHLEPATQYIISAFERYPLVALSEMHGNAESQALFISLVRDPDFYEDVSDIVVEFGNGLHQNVVDRYIAGGHVERDRLERIWRDTTQVSGIFSLPMYEEMLAAVRTVNATLAPAQHIRVWLGDPPIDWSVVTSPADEDMNDWRDAYFARVVEDRVRRHQRKALLFIGGAHIGRTVMFPNSLIHLLDARRPGETLVVSVLDVGGVAPEIAPRLLEWPRGSAGAVRGTWLGRLDAADIGFGFSTGTVEEDVDALVLLSHTPLAYAPPPPIDPLSPYGTELRRRRQLGMATGPFRGGGIRFKANEPILLPEAEKPLGEVLKELGRDRDLKVLVKAFADAREREPDVLSSRRAMVVVEWLVQRGIEADRLVARGCGSVRPLTFGATEGDRVRNRRAELVRQTATAGCEPPW
jgi:outer membrane protein OmpA-like peptidoglycan-associated protein